MVAEIREEAVRYLRAMAQQKQLKQTAAELGMSYNTLAAYTRGSRRPGVDTLAKIVAHISSVE